MVRPVIECGVNNERVSWRNRFRLSPDGKIAAVGMESGEVVLARLEDGRCTRIPAHKPLVIAMAFSPDGSTLVSSGADKLLKLWDVQSGKQIGMKASRTFVTAAQFTPDGRRLVIADVDPGVRILDATTLEELSGLRREPGAVGRIALYRGDILATASDDDRILLWDMYSGVRLATLVGHEGEIRDIAFSPDGMTLASTAADATARLWPVGQLLRDARSRLADAESWRTDLQFTAEYEILISCTRPYLTPLGSNSATSMSQWDVATGASEAIVKPGTYGRCDLALIPGTSRLLCGGPGSLSIKSRDSGKLIQLLDDDPLHEYQHVVVSHDGKWAAGCGHILQRPRQTDYFALQPRGNNCFIALYNLESRQRELFSLPTPLTDTWVINRIRFSPDDRFLVTAGGDGTALYRVDLFERTGGTFSRRETRELPRASRRSEVQDVAFSADSRLIGTVTSAGFGDVWSLEGPNFEAPIYRKNGLWSLAFSPDGRILALGDSYGIQLCDLQSQFPLATLPVGRAVSSLQFSPDGRTLAWSSSDGHVEFLRTMPLAPTPTKAH
jgi:WD40 repeat protein